MNNDAILVQTEQLTVTTKNGQVLVEPISITLYKGQNLTILGETGSGKSLLTQAIMGALPNELISNGKIFIENQQLDDKQLRQYWGKRMAMLPQEPSRSLDPTMTIIHQVFESIFFVAKKDKNTSLQQAKDNLSALGLSTFTDYYPHELSGGMAQRASFATATAGGAYIVIADESTKGLDETNKQAVIALLAQVAKNGGTLLTITHDIDVAKALNGEVMVMKKGQFIAAAPSNWQTTDKKSLQNNPLLTVKDLSLTRGNRTLFQELNFSLQKGEILGVIGGSCIGKSSLGDAICGLLKPAKGSITWIQTPKRHQVLKLYQDPPSAFSPMFHYKPY